MWTLEVVEHLRGHQHLDRPTGQRLRRRARTDGHAGLEIVRGTQISEGDGAIAARDGKQLALGGDVARVRHVSEDLFGGLVGAGEDVVEAAVWHHPEADANVFAGRVVERGAGGEGLGGYRQQEEGREQGGREG